MLQGDLVDLLDKMTGERWLPVGIFDDIGAGALGAIGGSTPVGFALATGADEHISTILKVPKDYDVTKSSTFTAYWSSTGTDDTKTFLASLSYIPRAVTEDVGATATILAGTADTDSATADVLNAAPAITLPADTFASVAELLYLSFFRDVSGDDVAGDVHFYGLLWEYSTTPEIDVTT